MIIAWIILVMSYLPSGDFLIVFLHLLFVFPLSLVEGVEEIYFTFFFVLTYIQADWWIQYKSFTVLIRLLNLASYSAARLLF